MISRPTEEMPTWWRMQEQMKTSHLHAEVEEEEEEEIEEEGEQEGEEKSSSHTSKMAAIVCPRNYVFLDSIHC